MSIKLALLKSGESVISDAKELISEGNLRAAVRSASMNEKPIVVTQLSQLLMDIERVREFEKLQDIVDAEIQKKRES